MKVKKCKACGFKYKDKKDLEKFDLLRTEASIEYYCPKCGAFIYREKATVFW